MVYETRPEEVDRSYGGVCIFKALGIGESCLLVGMYMAYIQCIGILDNILRCHCCYIHFFEVMRWIMTCDYFLYQVACVYISICKNMHGTHGCIVTINGICLLPIYRYS